MPDWLSKETFDAWWRVVTAAPHLSVLLILTCLIAGYVAARWRYAGKIETLEARLTLKDETVADYKRKLDGATPDEAKARIETLERLVAPLKPRDLTDGQALILTRHLSPLAPRSAEIGYAHGYAGCQEYAERLRAVFRGAGWTAQLNSIVAPFSKGLGLTVMAGLTPTREATAIFVALNEAEIAFTPVVDGRPSNGLAFRLVVGPRS